MEKLQLGRKRKTDAEKPRMDPLMRALKALHSAGSPEAMTPEELLRKDYPGEPDAAALVDYYNKARYSEEPIPDDAAACARTVLKKRL